MAIGLIPRIQTLSYSAQTATQKRLTRECDERRNGSGDNMDKDYLVLILQISIDPFPSHNTVICSMALT